MKKVCAAMAMLGMGTLVLVAQPKPPTPDELKALQEIAQNNHRGSTGGCSGQVCAELPQERLPELRLDHGG